jgi:hypothetical protein
MAARYLLRSGAAMTLSWVARDGTEYHDLAPTLEVWDSGAQIHMEYEVEHGLMVQVLLDDGETLLAGKIEKCDAEKWFGYIVEMTLVPKSVWSDGFRRLYHPRCHGGDLAQAM